MELARLIGAAAVVALSATAGARIVVEDFSNDTGTAPEFDSFFDYDFGDTRDFVDGDSNNVFVGSLLLSPDRVVISFNTLPGETVIGASITSMELRAPGQTMVRFHGSLGTHTMLSNVQTTPELFQLPFGQVGTINSIEIIGNETLIREIRVETQPGVPAPAGAALLGIAGVGVCRRRRRA